ncbi:hypothetical protein ACOME3_002043 [Neoechinorhynchus agilis]
MAQTVSEEVRQKLKCPICNRFLRNPVRHVECLRPFCKKCIWDDMANQLTYECRECGGSVNPVRPWSVFRSDAGLNNVLAALVITESPQAAEPDHHSPQSEKPPENDATQNNDQFDGWISLKLLLRKNCLPSVYLERFPSESFFQVSPEMPFRPLIKLIRDKLHFTQKELIFLRRRKPAGGAGGRIPEEMTVGRVVELSKSQSSSPFEIFVDFDKRMYDLAKEDQRKKRSQKMAKRIDKVKRTEVVVVKELAAEAPSSINGMENPPIQNSHPHVHVPEQQETPPHIAQVQQTFQNGIDQTILSLIRSGVLRMQSQIPNNAVPTTTVQPIRQVVPIQPDAQRQSIFLGQTNPSIFNHLDPRLSHFYSNQFNQQNMARMRLSRGENPNSFIGNPLNAFNGFSPMIFNPVDTSRPNAVPRNTIIKSEPFVPTEQSNKPRLPVSTRFCPILPKMDDGVKLSVATISKPVVNEVRKANNRSKSARQRRYFMTSDGIAKNKLSIKLKKRSKPSRINQEITTLVRDMVCIVCKD